MTTKEISNPIGQDLKRREEEERARLANLLRERISGPKISITVDELRERTKAISRRVQAQGSKR